MSGSVRGEGTPYLSYQPTIGRNSLFVRKTEEQREELGGIEYRGLEDIGASSIMYFCCFHILGWICLVPWILKIRQYGDVVRSAGQGRVWWALFTASSLFNDLGFTLTANSMISFQNAIFLLLFGTFLLIIGNTRVSRRVLRFVIWVASRLVPLKQRCLGGVTLPAGSSSSMLHFVVSGGSDMVAICDSGDPELGTCNFFHHFGSQRPCCDVSGSRDTVLCTRTVPSSLNKDRRVLLSLTLPSYIRPFRCRT